MATNEIMGFFNRHDIMRIESGDTSTDNSSCVSVLENQNLISLVQNFHVKGFISRFIYILFARMGSKGKA